VDGRDPGVRVDRAERLALLGTGAWTVGVGAIVAGGAALSGSIGGLVALGGLLVALVAVVLARRSARERAAGGGPPPPIRSGRAGLVQRLRERIDPPAPEEPEDWMILTVLPFHEGPLVHSAVEGAGIEALLQEIRPLPSHHPDKHRIVVRRRDLAEARQILEDLNGPGLPRDPFEELS
jgi:hypothetical protein